MSFAPGTAWLLGPLAPAAACALLTLAICGTRGDFSTGPCLPGISASNVNNTAYAMDSFPDKQNCWALVTFQSTNHSGLGSIMGPFRH